MNDCALATRQNARCFQTKRSKELTFSPRSAPTQDNVVMT